MLFRSLPFEDSVPPPYVGSPDNVAFVSDGDGVLREVLLAGGVIPDFWVHGHTHTACDYLKDDIRVLCNPLGYPREANTLEDMYIDVG